MGRDFHATRATYMQHEMQLQIKAPLDGALSSIPLLRVKTFRCDTLIHQTKQTASDRPWHSLPLEIQHRAVSPTGIKAHKKTK